MLSGGRIEKKLLILHENFQQNHAVLELFDLNFKIKGKFSSLPTTFIFITIILYHIFQVSNAIHANSIIYPTEKVAFLYLILTGQSDYESVAFQ